jgi:hypothetical protein
VTDFGNTQKSGHCGSGKGEACGVFQLTLIAILLVGLVGKSPKTQAFVVIAYVVLELAANIVARTELGALAPG